MSEYDGFIQRSRAQPTWEELAAALAEIEALGRDGLATPQELALIARSALRLKA